MSNNHLTTIGPMRDNRVSRDHINPSKTAIPIPVGPNQFVFGPIRASGERDLREQLLDACGPVGMLIAATGILAAAAAAAAAKKDNACNESTTKRERKKGRIVCG